MNFDNVLHTFLTLRFLPIVNTNEYWERLPTSVLISMIDKCFQAAWVGRGTREYHIDTLKMLFKYIDENHSSFRSVLIRLLHQYYTEHPAELTLVEPGQMPTSSTLSSEPTTGASGDSSTLKA